MNDDFTNPLVEGVDTGLDSPMVEMDATPDGVVTVTINRADRKNAFNAALIDALARNFEVLKDQPGVRIVFVQGKGGTFSAGADLDWMAAAAQLTEDDNRADAMEMAKMLKALHDIPALTVALIEGGAFGGGAGLAAACDLAVATADAKFSFSEVRLGLVPATISPYVVRAIGPRMARALFAMGRVFDAAYAQQIGLITDVVPNAAGLASARAHLAKEIMACAPGAVGASKRLADDVYGRDIDHGLMEDTAKRIARARVGEEGKEGVAAFLGKRKPSWAG